MTEAGYEDGSNREHERLYSEVVADEPGYFYIYLSNDGTEGGEAFFDDFSILTLESYIVQQTDYYPYGLIARNFVRAGEKETKELFQGKTYEELTGWYDFHARQYDAAVGRWFGVDPKAGVMPYNSPYASMMNNPVMFTDPDGKCPICPIFVGAAIGLITNGISNTVNNQNFFKGGYEAAVFGAFGAGISQGIGQFAQVLADGGKSALFVGSFQAGAHGLSGGGLSSAQGGNFWHGFASGGISSGVSSGISALGGNGLSQWIGGGLSGGIGSSIAGGSFWQGVGQGLITGGLNHAADAIQFNLTKDQLIKMAVKEGLCNPCNSYEIGLIFENIVAGHLRSEGYKFTRGRLLQTDLGNTVPDFFVELEGNRTGKRYKYGGIAETIVEVKAKNAGSYLGLFSQNSQILKQLILSRAMWGRHPGGVHSLYTTADIKVSPNILTAARSLNVTAHHYYSVYNSRLSFKNIGFRKNY